MATPDRPRLPQTEPQESRAQAEDFLDQADIPRAIACALLAIAGELHTIRRSLTRK